MMHTLFEGPVLGPVRAFGPIGATSFDREPPITETGEGFNTFAIRKVQRSIVSTTL
jgi:hypothetical protein